jgi:hypothetical protein
MEQRNAECPVCQEPLNKLAERLPHAHCSQSRLICRLSGLPLNEHNLPMMLPNGRVYGEQVFIHISGFMRSRTLLSNPYFKSPGLANYGVEQQWNGHLSTHQGGLRCQRCRESLCHVVFVGLSF